MPIETTVYKYKNIEEISEVWKDDNTPDYYLCNTDSYVYIDSRRMLIYRHPIVGLIKSKRPIFMIDLLLRENDDIKGDANFYDGHWHSLKWAWNHIEIMDLLIRYGANPNIGHTANCAGISYLATAVDDNDVDIVKLLLEHSASPYITNFYNQHINVLEFLYSDDDDIEIDKADKIKQMVLERMYLLNYQFNLVLKDGYTYNGSDSDDDNDSDD